MSKSFDEITKGYNSNRKRAVKSLSQSLVLERSNSLVKLFLKKDFFIFYTKNFSHTTDSNVKYKKDKYRIIEILNLAIFKKIISKKKLIISENKYIEIINLNNNIYKFEYYKNNKIKTHGTFKVINNKLISFEEKTNNILIIKNK